MLRELQWDLTEATTADEPIVFRLGTGQFRCVTPYAPPGAVAQIGAANLTSLQGCIGFIEGVLADEAEVERFRVVINSRDPIVPPGVLGEVMNGLIEEYGHRPFGPPSGSANGSVSTAPSSAAGSSSPADGSPT